MKQFKRVIAIVLAAIMLMSFASCSMVDESSTDITNDNIKIGVLLTGTLDSTTDDSGYALAAINELTSYGYGINGERFKYVESVDPNNAEAVSAALTTLINFECNLIIGTDGAFIDDIQKVSGSEDNADVKFFVLNAENDGKNIYGYKANITCAAYVTGIVAGMKAAELQVAKVGFLAEDDKDLVVLNAFAMGVKSVNEAATVSVVYGTDAQQAADKLIKEGCVVLASDYEDESIAKAAQDRKIFFCGFGSETYASYADAFLCAPLYNFTQIYMDAIKAVVDNKEPAADAFAGDYKSGATYLSDLNETLVAEGTQDAVNKAVKEITGGQLTFTVVADTPFENIVVVK